MRYYMRLQPEPFNKIRSGTKKIEIRLFDEKRQQLKVDDLIIFTRMDDESEHVQAKIINLVQFNLFKDLYDAYDLVLYGGEKKDEYESMYQYYSIEDEQKYGVLAIHLQVV